jgi:hypothetical protein
VLLLLACTHQQAWVASGESIAAIGSTYDAVGAQMDRALDTKRIDEATYRRWAAFCHYYRPLYDTARDRWLHSDDPAAEHAAAVLAALSAELTQWGVVAAGGKP